MIGTTNVESLTYLTTTSVLSSNIITYNKSVTLTTSWSNTGITSGDLAQGVHIVVVDNFPSGWLSQWSQIYAGLMTWYSGGTNDNHADEIPLHNCGHAGNGAYIYLRTLRSSNTDGKVYLQIRGSGSSGSAATLRFRFKRLL